MSSGGIPSSQKRYGFPVKPYAVQQQVVDTIHASLHERKHGTSFPRPLVAIEVPTGCGKTLALLSSALSFQAEMKQLSVLAADEYLKAGSPRGSVLPPCDSAASNNSKKKRAKTATLPNSKPSQKKVKGSGGDSDNDDDDGWRVSQLFFRQFRLASNKRLRAEVDPLSTNELRKHHTHPPCSVFYVTRTHAQVRQADHELRKFTSDSKRVKVNVLGSRDKYCVCSHVHKARQQSSLSHSRNNLGEVCDKLVSLGQCPAVHTYGELANRAITTPIGGRKDMVWDMEDLVNEGVSTNSCPYYAARDLVFFSDITFATYNYFLDPVIRHETKMEGALRNHSIIIFDEAHNVCSVCQDALSILDEDNSNGTNQASDASRAHRDPEPSNASVEALYRIVREVEPLLAPNTLLSYPRDFNVSVWTLREMFTFVYDLFRVLATWTRTVTRPVDSSNGPYVEDPMCVLVVDGSRLATMLLTTVSPPSLPPEYAMNSPTRFPSNAFTRQQVWMSMFKFAYGVIMSLGVSFNPFEINTVVLGAMKRWLVVLRFLLVKPASFVVCVREQPLPPGTLSWGDANPAAAAMTRGGATTAASEEGGVACTRRSCCIRCLDPSLAFQHLLRSTYRVVLASGTLSPLPQLAVDLGISLDRMHIVEGDHVVPPAQYRAILVKDLQHHSDSSLPSKALQCTYTTLSENDFMSRLGKLITDLTSTLNGPAAPLSHVESNRPRNALTRGRGGVLVFCPNYGVARRLEQDVKTWINRTTHDAATREKGMSNAPTIFIEPRSSDEVQPLLARYQQRAEHGIAVMFAVFRGKISEGLDFTNDMARLVVSVGVPLRPLKEWTVVAQRRYSGEAWYMTDAIRAVNQALGRCLRHRDDYGAIVLLDCRFAADGMKAQLSKWFRDAVQEHEGDASVMQMRSSLVEFFVQMGLGSRKEAEEDENPSTSLRVACTEVAPLCDAGSLHSIQPSPVYAGVHWTRQLLHTAPVSPKPTLSPRETNDDKNPSSSCSESGKNNSRSDFTNHPWREMVVKLLYESCSSTSDVSRQQLEDHLRSMDEEFGHP